MNIYKPPEAYTWRQRIKNALGGLTMMGMGLVATNCDDPPRPEEEEDTTISDTRDTYNNDFTREDEGNEGDTSDTRTDATGGDPLQEPEGNDLIDETLETSVELPDLDTNEIEAGCETDADCSHLNQSRCSTEGEEAWYDQGVCIGDSDMGFNCTIQSNLVDECSNYNRDAINDCNYDDNTMTLDTSPEFTSVCGENYECTNTEIVVETACSVSECEAEWDEENPCLDTVCETICVGNDLHVYENVPNDGLDDCICTAYDCAEPTIIENSDACIECRTDDNCNDLNNNHCLDGSVMHVEGVCNTNFECETNTTTVTVCGDLDSLYCDNSEIKSDVYTCENAECVLDSSTVLQDCNDLDNSFCDGSLVRSEDYGCENAECVSVNESSNDCNDGVYCNGVEGCVEDNGDASCETGVSPNCSDYNLEAVATCDHDGNSSTWDSRSAFESSCIEEAEGYSCTSGDPTVNSECDADACSAECDPDTDCAPTLCDHLDGCYEGTYRDYSEVQNVCGDCSCTVQSCTEYDENGTNVDGDHVDEECGDCNNNTPAFEMREVCADLDEDNYYSESFEHCVGEQPPEGFSFVCTGPVDCNNGDPNINPGASENTGQYPDGIDNNCDDVVDEFYMVNVINPGETATFIMGCDPNLFDDCGIIYNPAHEVTLTRAYAIDGFETTNTQFNECVADGGCDEPAQGVRNMDPNAPVTRVSWDQADAYCAWAGKRLPTDAEWEYAARGDDQRPYSWGFEEPTSELAVYNSNESEPVGSRSPQGDSPFGASDLSGNVREWVSNWSELSTGDPETDPTGPENGSGKSIKDGHYANTEGFYLRAFNFGGLPPETTSRTIGFRCVVPLSPE